MSLPVFAPPVGGVQVNPSYGSGFSSGPRTSALDLGKGWESREAHTIRQTRRVSAVWRAAPLELFEYVDSFVHALGGGVGPFEWKGFLNVSAPRGISPTLTEVISGSLAGTTYYVVFTWYHSVDGETTESARSQITVPANRVIKVEVPAIPSDAEGFRVYASETSGAEKLQATVTSGRSWTQSGALLTTGDPPASNSLETTRRFILSGDWSATPIGPDLFDVTVPLQELI